MDKDENVINQLSAPIIFVHALLSSSFYLPPDTEAKINLFPAASDHDILWWQQKNF